MRTKHRLLSTVALAALIGAASAGWPTDPSVNVPLCAVVESQQRPCATPDGAGGFIVAWQDSRSGSADIYAQRVSAEGVPLWTADGVVVCDEENQQWRPAIVSDGAGGAIVLWEDRRVTGADIYAQRIDASGARVWANGGVVAFAADDTQEEVKATSDGAGGAIFVWLDERSQSGPDVLAQRIDAGGNRVWAAEGVACCTAADDQYDAEILPDGQGGAIVVWEDGRAGGVYLQRVLANGSTQWTDDGIPVSATGGYRSEHAVTSDGSGGVIVAWTDDRNGSRDIFAQRFDGTGAALWASNGIALCADAAQQDDAFVAPDGTGGAIVAWEDYRGADRDVYAQRVDSRGDVIWTLDGVLVCGEAEMQATTALVSDGAGGAIVTWRDWREFQQKIGEDLYSQRIDATGSLLWDATGFPVSTAGDAQQGQVMLPADEGAAFVVWEDRRDERTSDRKVDIYAQRIGGSGGSGATPVCTIGSALVVQGTGFGAAKKPKAYVLYEKKPGKQKVAALKVQSWTDTTIDATWKKKVPLATYAVWVKPKGGQPTQFGEVVVVGPTPDAGQNLAGAPKTRLAVTGMHFGTKQGKVLVEYVNTKGKTKRKRCKVVKKTWLMDPVTGTGSIDFLVPKLPLGSYDLIIVGKLGEARLQLTIN